MKGLYKGCTIIIPHGKIGIQEGTVPRAGERGCKPPILPGIRKYRNRSQAAVDGPL
jgi:hypothetical protein